MINDLSRRLRWEASRLPNKFSTYDELFQLLTEAADELDRRESLVLRLQEAAEIAEHSYSDQFSALFREAAIQIEGMRDLQHKAYLDGRKSAFIQLLGSVPPGELNQ